MSRAAVVVPLSLIVVLTRFSQGAVSCDMALFSEACQNYPLLFLSVTDLFSVFLFVNLIAFATVTLSFIGAGLITRLYSDTLWDPVYGAVHS